MFAILINIFVVWVYNHLLLPPSHLAPQNKFYKGDGHKFVPFSFVLLAEEEDKV